MNKLTEQELQIKMAINDKWNLVKLTQVWPDGHLINQLAHALMEANTELLALREQQPVSFEWRQHYSSIGKSGPWVKLNDQRTYEKLKFKHAGDADYEFRELFTAAKPAGD